MKTTLLLLIFVSTLFSCSNSTDNNYMPYSGESVIKAVALPVLRHRLVTNFNAEAENVTTNDIVQELLKQK